MDSDDELESSPVISIENTVNLETHQNYIDHYFTRKYCIDLNQKNNDHCLLIHSNRLCVLTLAPSHPLVCQDIRIRNIDFQISKNVNRLENKACGKRKRNAQYVSLTSPVCFIECSNDVKFTITCPVPGKLLEINEQLRTHPELLELPFDDHHHRACYIALVLPKHNISMDELTKNLMSEEQYQKSVSDRSAEVKQSEN